MIDLLQHRAFRQLDLQHRRLDAVRLGNFDDECAQIAAHQLTRRKVDGNRHQRELLLAPTRHVRPDMPPHELAYRIDQPGFLGDGQESCRWNEAFLRILPANERLECHDPLRFDVENRLVVHVELSELERRPQARFQVHPLVEFAIHDGAENLEVVATAVLGLIHGGVGVTQQRADVVAVSRKHAETDAHRGDERLAGNDQRHLETCKNTGRSFVCLFEGFDAAQDHHELIAAHAHDDVLGAHRRLDALRDFLQKLVADLVAVRIVDVFEAIEIEEQHCQRRSRLARLLHRHRQVRREEQSRLGRPVS